MFLDESLANEIRQQSRSLSAALDVDERAQHPAHDLRTQNGIRKGSFHAKWPNDQLVNIEELASETGDHKTVAKSDTCSSGILAR